MYAAAAIPPETSSPAKRAEPAAGKQKPKLLDRLREALRSRQYSRRTEQSYLETGMTSAPSRNSWDTRTSARR